MPKLQVSLKHRLIRLWVSPTHSYTLGFYNPRIDADWYVMLGDEKWEEVIYLDGTNWEPYDMRTFFCLG